MKSDASKVPDLLNWLERGMKIVAAASLLGMALITFYDVNARALFNDPLFGTEEIVAILAVITVGFSLPYAHRQGSHIGVDLVYRKLPRGVRKVVALSTSIASCALFAVVGWCMLTYGFDLREAGELTMNLALPTWRVVFVLSFGFFVFALFLLRDAVRILRGGEV